MFRKLLVLVALMLPSAAQAAWREASTDHFVIYSEQSAKSLQEFATRLERFDKAMRFLRNLPDVPVGPANRLTIFAVSNERAVRKLYGRGASAGRYGVAGFYSPRASGSVAITPRSAGGGTKFDLDAETVLLHEYAHHFMMQNYSGALPAWLIEGYAEFHSTATFGKDGSVGIGEPALHRAYGLVHGYPLSVEKMVAVSDAELSPELRESLYGRGWLLTHYLTFEPSRRTQLRDYILRLNQGETSLAAAKAAFGDLKLLDKELDAYLRRRKMHYWKIPPSDIPIGKVTVRDLGAGENAIMDVKIRSKRGVSLESAKALLPLARKAAAPFPKDVAVQTMLAEAEYDAGNLVEAEAAADRALAVNPKAIDALIYKGRARMAAAKAAGRTDAGTWAEVRKWLIAANRVDPDDPEPLVLFYASFGLQGLEATANATLGLTTALMLAPQDRALRLMVARQHLVDGKAAEARAALVPVAYDPHGGETSKAAAAIIAKLDTSGAKDALKEWESISASEEETEPS